jgi:ribosome-binding factor A
MADRITRLNKIFLRELSALLRDSFRLEATLLTITRVEVSADLRHAVVFFSGPNDNAITAGKMFLHRNMHKLKCAIAKRIRLHHFPDFHFRHDKGQINELRVYEILDNITIRSNAVSGS